MASTSKKKKTAGVKAKRASSASTVKQADAVLDPSRLRITTPGIPDAYFERVENVPITKEEVRALIISKARIGDGDYVLDVGSGSGSITIEAAIQTTGNGLVTGIDHDEAAVNLAKRNIERFNVVGYTGIIHGDALEVLGRIDDDDLDDYEPGEIPASSYSAIIIGGTGGDTAKIVKECVDLLVPKGRIVISTILIETLHAVLEVIDEMPLKDIDITQITISKSRRTSTGTMMLARNPVTIISATRK